MADPQIILDAHLDIAYNTIMWKRDFAQGVYKQRQREANTDIPQKEGVITAALPEALLGRVGVVFGTLFTRPSTTAPNPADVKIGYSTPREAYQSARNQFDVYQKLADEHANITLIRTKAELESVLATWQDGIEFAQHKLGIVISMEGGDPILEPSQFEEWYAMGVRAVGPAWKETRYTAGTGRPGPLTPLGRELLEVMADLNAILDVSHMAQEACLEALDRYEGPIIASHSNARRFSDTDRHLNDDTIRRLVERDGVIGMPLYNPFLKNGWTPTDKKQAVTLGHVTASIDYICQLIGSAQHVGIGSDLDGGFGLNSTPAEIDTITDLHLIGSALNAKGYAPADINSILSGNFLRILRRSLPG